MNKLLYIALVILISFQIVNAQDNDEIITEEDVKLDKTEFNSEDTVYIWFDSLQSNEKGRSIVFDKNYKNKYSDDVFNYRNIESNVDLSDWEKFKRRVKDFFENLFDFSKENMNRSAFDWFIRIVFYCIIAIAVYFIIRLILRKENSWFFAKAPTNIFYNFKEEENIHIIPFQDKIAAEIENKNYRRAIRYYYLWMLKKLNDDKVIVFDIEKTNSDYQSEIKNVKLKEDFKYLSYIYNYCWYGEFDINEEDFIKVEKVYRKLLN